MAEDAQGPNPFGRGCPCFLACWGHIVAVALRRARLQVAAWLFGARVGEVEPPGVVRKVLDDNTY